jgi:5-methyltetrahydropteroyltriglutamate--homocysteine methyltransferase
VIENPRLTRGGSHSRLRRHRRPKKVIAGTDCGLGGRVHPQIAWAKLRALREGAAIASKKLWS